MEANASYFKFTVVRHPMDRLLSCYIDKLLNNNQTWIDENASKSLPYRLKQRARQLMVNNKRRAGGLNNVNNTPWKEGDNRDIMPTFEEFLEFVLSTRSFDGIIY